MGRGRTIRKYLAGRMLSAAGTFFVLATLLFILFRLVPGDPTLTVLSPALSPEVQADLRQRFGLDQPMAVQYALYLGNIVTAHFGTSFGRGVPVVDLLGERVVNTLILMLPALVLAYGLGIAGGALIAWKRGSRLERSVTLFAIMFRAAPVFWICIVFIAVFSIRLGLFPSGHMLTPGAGASEGLGQYLSLDFVHHLALPLIVMTLYYGCYPLLVMRTSMLEVLGDDFIDLCKAKGLSEGRVVFRHALRASLLPIATSVSLLAAYAVAGSVLVEAVFSWPGVGRLMVEAVLDSDYPVAQAAFLLIALLTVLGNLAADMLYGFIDPRIRHS
ncbi:MAG: ABC transporter permease [Alphaproteobacteria bacterium]